MTAFLLASLISAVTLVSLVVLIGSLRRAVSAFGELRRTLATCPEIVMAEVKMMQPVIRPQLRVISRSARPLAQQTVALRAAA